MAMGNIQGDTGKIKSTASDIRSYAKAYGSAAENIFNAVDKLKATWTSEDGNAYIAKINGYRAGFEEMQKKLETSAEALEAAAIAYEQAIAANTIR